MNNRFFFTPGNVNDQDLGKIQKNLNAMRRGPVADIWNTVIALWKMATDPYANWGSRLLAIGALLYLVSPIDAIPDAIPFLGLTDDVAILTATAAKISSDLRKYL